jgi:hypothetical protein
MVHIRFVPTARTATATTRRVDAKALARRRSLAKAGGSEPFKSLRGCR